MSTPDPKHRELWRALERWRTPPAPPGFATRVTARMRGERGRSAGLALAPLWVRWAAAGAFVLGVGLGIGAGFTSPSADETTLAGLEIGWSDTYADRLDGLAGDEIDP